MSEYDYEGSWSNTGTGIVVTIPRIGRSRNGACLAKEWPMLVGVGGISPAELRRCVSGESEFDTLDLHYGPGNLWKFEGEETRRPKDLGTGAQME
jgi:hypothetical protein